MINKLRVGSVRQVTGGRNPHVVVHRTGTITSDRGMATLETAIMIPVLLAVTAVFLSIIVLGIQTLSLSDATRTAARDLARGVPAETVRSDFLAREPDAEVDVVWGEESVTVHTRKQGELLVPFLSAALPDLRQTHVAPRETLINGWE